MSAHVLLKSLNELRKRDKMRGLPIILSLFRNEFKDIEILAIILVPLIMTLSRGHTGQIKGQS